MTAVDADGNVISDQYKDLPLESDEEVIDLVACPLKEDVTRSVQVEGTNRFYVESFDYQYATVDDEKVESINKDELEQDTLILLHYANEQRKTNSAILIFFPFLPAPSQGQTRYT